MGRQSILSIGREAFLILEMFEQENSVASIRKLTGKSYQNVQSFKQDLEKAGWIVKVSRGEYKLTKDGQWFLDFIRRRQ